MMCASAENISPEKKKRRAWRGGGSGGFAYLSTIVLPDSFSSRRNFVKRSVGKWEDEGLGAEISKSLKARNFRKQKKEPLRRFWRLSCPFFGHAYPHKPHNSNPIALQALKLSIPNILPLPYPFAHRYLPRHPHLSNENERRSSRRVRPTETKASPPTIPSPTRFSIQVEREEKTAFFSIGCRRYSERGGGDVQVMGPRFTGNNLRAVYWTELGGEGWYKKYEALEGILKVVCI
ncbi:unnamed protein product [Bursaphelenchus xylophilus]|uniref:(pine wood nematode) hypothetical protein n=1 Tax=Bursaphelenchus xylophilus TaxID=6326 RepID=A0A1I7RZL2_BURXY|nr:unnamed protein product [Bursaphelenchus xylophilus]CAG9111364.1 unnamed protein product [Bursaphelenchus xylophilus]